MGILETDADDIARKVRAWSPKEDASNEKDFEAALAEYLHAEFPKEVFDRQYRRGRTSADLRVKFIEDKVEVAIELKAGLVSRSDYHRLLGQMWTYVEEWEHEVVVVLCGGADTALARRTGRFAEAISEQRGKKVRVVVVGDTVTGAEKD